MWKSEGEGNLYVVGIAFNRNFDQKDLPVDTAPYVAKNVYYTFTNNRNQNIYADKLIVGA